MTEEVDQEVALAELGARLKKLRLSTGLTQSKLAWRVGLRGSSISAIERGTHGHLGRVLLGNIADAMGYALEEVLGDTGYVPLEKSRGGTGLGQRRHVPEAARAPRTGHVHPLVKELRLERQKQLSQQKLAAKLGYSSPSVNGWEYGHAQPTVGVVAEWARVLGFELVLRKIEESE